MSIRIIPPIPIYVPRKGASREPRSTAARPRRRRLQNLISAEDGDHNA